MVVDGFELPAAFVELCKAIQWGEVGICVEGHSSTSG